MSQEERDDLDWLKRVEAGSMTQREAAEKMGVTARWVRKLVKPLRGWMIEAGLWKSKAQTIEDVHVWRPRRSGFGELVQWDTSDHDWLEGRGRVRYLVRLIECIWSLTSCLSFGVHSKPIPTKGA